MRMLKFQLSQWLAILFLAFIVNDCQASDLQKIELKVITLSAKDLTDISTLEVDEAQRKDPIKVPNLNEENSSALEKIKAALACEEKVDPQVLTGNFGLVRTTKNLALKLSVPVVTPMQEVAGIMYLTKNLNLKPVQGLKLCIPYKIFSFRCDTEKLGVEPYCVHVMNRIQPQANMTEIVKKATYNNSPLELHYIETFCRNLGQMQAASLMISCAQPTYHQLVCDTHYDLNASNIIVTQSFTPKTKPEFTLIDCADFTRGSSPDAAPVSVDILYFFLRTSEHAFVRQEGPAMKKQEEIIKNINRYAVSVFRGYFSSFNKDQLNQLQPIFTTELAFELFLKFTKWGYNKKFEFTLIIPTIEGVLREVKNAIPQNVKKSEGEAKQGDPSDRFTPKQFYKK